MKIISRFKDFYDYVEHQQGGGDPLLPYLRDKVLPDEPMWKGATEMREGTYKSRSYGAGIWTPNDKTSDGITREFRGLFVAGRVYRLARHYIAKSGYYPNIVPEQLVKDWHITSEVFQNFEQGQKSEYAHTMAKELNAPVFLCDHNEAYGHCPKLGPLGMVNYMSAEQVYQEIAMFISNELRRVEQPATSVTDVQKAEAHGFDKRQSFRHRK